MSNYRREIHPFFQRLVSIWYIITKQNYILVLVEEGVSDGQNTRRVKPIYRTDYSGESDLLTLTAAHTMCKKRYDNE